MRLHHVLVLLALCYCRTAGMKIGWVPDWLFNEFCAGGAIYVALPWDCTGYLHCGSTGGSWLNCPRGLFFNAKNQICETKSPTCEKPATAANIWCSKFSNLRFPHPDSCAMYYDCSKTEASPEFGLDAYVNECSWPQLFDPVEMICRDDNPAKPMPCDRKPTTRCDYAKVTECTATSGGSSVCSTLTDGLHPNPREFFTSSFVTCMGGTLVEEGQCAQDEVFHPDLHKCSRDYQAWVNAFCKAHPAMKLPDPTSCSLYYDCTEPRAHFHLRNYQTECTYTQLFDVESKSCKPFDELTNPCGTRKEPKAPCEYEVMDCPPGKECIPCGANCVGLSDGYQPYPSMLHTRFYIQCRGERTITREQCPIPKIFLPQLGACGLRSQIGQTTPTTTQESTTPPTPTVNSTESTSVTTAGANGTTADAIASATTTSSSGEVVMTTSMATGTSTAASMSASTAASNVSTSAARSTARPTTGEPEQTTVSSVITTAANTNTAAASSNTTSVPGQCGCVDELNQVLASVESVNSTVETLAATLSKPAPHDCDAPPSFINSEHQIIYRRNLTVAEYSCEDDYAMCGSISPRTCSKNNNWTAEEETGRCEQNTWRNAEITSLKGTIALPCLPEDGSALVIKGQHSLSRFQFSLIGDAKEHLLTVVINKGLVTILDSNKNVSKVSHVNAEGEVTFTVVINTASFKVFLDGYYIGNVSHSLDTLQSISTYKQEGKFDVNYVRFYLHDIPEDLVGTLWSPDVCPLPPLIPGITVQLSYTFNKAIATYQCPSGTVMCKGSDVITCSSEAGWDGAPGECTQTNLGEGELKKQTKFQLCSLQIGSALELWMTPTTNTGEWILDTTNGESVRFTYEFRGSLRSIDIRHVKTATVTVDDPPLYPDKEVHIVLYMLTDVLRVKMDGQTVVDYNFTDYHSVDAYRYSDSVTTRQAKLHTWKTSDIVRERVDANLALNANVITSSEPQNPGSYVVDGNPEQSGAAAMGESCWTSSDQDTSPMVVIDLELPYFIREVRLDVLKACKGCNEKLRDVTVEVFNDIPSEGQSGEGTLCAVYEGEISKSEVQTLKCRENVWGRYVMIKGVKLEGSSDVMTICEAEVFGDKVVMKKWTPSDCPAPPKFVNAKVDVTYTTSEASATYTCLEGYAMCGGTSHSSCAEDKGWSAVSGRCASNTVYDNHRDNLSPLIFPCTLKIGQMVEVLVTLKGQSTTISLGRARMSDMDVYVQLIVTTGKNGKVTASSPSVATISDITTNMAHTEDSDVIVRVISLTDALYVFIDDMRVYMFHTEYDQYPAHIMDMVTANPGLVRKLSILPIKDATLGPQGHINLDKATAIGSTNPASAGSAIDSDTVSCWSAEDGNLAPWWQMDMHTYKYVSQVEITSRSDDCGPECKNRLHDFDIRVFYDDPQKGGQGEVCAKYVGVFPHATTRKIICNKPLYGRFIRIGPVGPRKTPTDVLTICEVNVIGGDLRSNTVV